MWVGHCINCYNIFAISNTQKSRDNQDPPSLPSPGFDQPAADGGIDRFQHIFMTTRRNFSFILGLEQIDHVHQLAVTAISISDIRFDMDTFIGGDIGSTGFIVDGELADTMGAGGCLFIFFLVAGLEEVLYFFVLN